MTGVWIAVAAVVVALVFGGYRALTDGRFRGTHRVHGVAEDDLAPVTAEPALWDSLGQYGPLGELATLVQFSSAFCAPCRAARRVLEEVAAIVPGVRHVEIDAEHHLEVVRAWGILRTPTTVVLDSSGREVTRAQGAPTKVQVLTALAQVGGAAD